MKKIFITLLAVFLLFSCDDEFTNIAPKGSLNSQSLANEQGVDLLLIGAYSMLDGFRFGLDNDFMSSGDNWWFDVVSDDAHKGVTNGDQNELYLLEHYDWATNNPFIKAEWLGLYAGVNRCNAVLAQANIIEEGDLTQQVAEAKFLRAHFNFELQRIFKNVPYIGEEDLGDPNKPNLGPIWDTIEEDFLSAIAVLPEIQGEVGRANIWAAKAYLGKVYLYQNKYTEAIEMLQDVINNGPFGLSQEYSDNFTIAGENGVEAVFSIQFLNDGADSYNGNRGGALNHPGGGPLGTCCGFYQPSQDLVNAFQTDGSGLPLLDTWNQTDVVNDQGIASSDPFTVHGGPLDPRLDFTVGRRDIDFNGFGKNPGADWVRSQVNGGPYLASKNTYRAMEPDARSIGGPWGQDRAGINYNIIRYADVLLMAAEALVERPSPDLATALNYVNQIRNRAKSSTSIPTVPGVNPTNYSVEPYTSFSNQEFARKAVRFERRIELAMEGHRYFDLARWGVLDATINTYFPIEERTIPGINIGVQAAPKHNTFPIPLEAIDLSNGLLMQNPDW